MRPKRKGRSSEPNHPRCEIEHLGLPFTKLRLFHYRAPSHSRRPAGRGNRSYIRLVAACVLAACAALPAACGNSQEDNAADTVTTYIQAVEENDAEKACNQLAPEGKAAVGLAVLTATLEEPSGPSVEDCPAVHRAYFKLLDPKRLPASEAQDTDIAGDRARVETADGAWQLEERDGDWKLRGTDPLLERTGQLPDPECEKQPDLPGC